MSCRRQRWVFRLRHTHTHTHRVSAAFPMRHIHDAREQQASREAGQAVLRPRVHVYTCVCATRNPPSLHVCNLHLLHMYTWLFISFAHFRAELRLYLPFLMYIFNVIIYWFRYFAGVIAYRLCMIMMIYCFM